jgi:zinc protease
MAILAKLFVEANGEINMTRTFITLMLCSLLSLASVARPPHANSALQSPASGAALPTVDQVIENYVKALGGKTALEKITSRTLKGAIEWGDLMGTAEHYFKAPNKYMSVTTLSGISGEGVYREGFNGIAGWSISLTGNQRDWSGPEVALAQRNRDFYKELRLKTIYPSIALKGKEKIGDKEAYVLELTPASGRPDKLYFDVATGLLLRHAYVMEGSQGSSEYEYNYDDYREVNGVKVAFLHRRAKPSNITIRVSEVKFNLDLDDAKFNRPTAQ